MALRVLVFLAVLSCGCGSYFTEAGHDAATGAVGGVTSPDATKRLSDLTAAATKSARDELLGPNTDAELRALLERLDPEIQKLLRDTAATAREQLNTLITQELEARVRQLLRSSIDEALDAKTLGEANALREELVGTPLQKDLDALIDAAAPHLSAALAQAVQTSLAPLQSDLGKIKVDADTAAQKWKPIAIGFAVGTGILLICLVLAVLVIRSHHRMIATLMRERVARV